MRATAFKASLEPLTPPLRNERLPAAVSGNHRARVLASHWLGSTHVLLPIPADVAVDRVEQLLEAIGGEPWAEAGQLLSVSYLNAYLGRIADARAEVEWLAGAPDQAVASLRAALAIYEDRRVAPLAELARTALAGLAAEPSRSSRGAVTGSPRCGSSTC